MIEYGDSGSAVVRCGESEIAGRRIAAKALPYVGEAGEPAFRFDPLERRLLPRPSAGRVAVGPADPSVWQRAFSRCPAGPVLVGPGSAVEEVRGAGAAAAEGAARAGRGVYLLDPGVFPADSPESLVALFVWTPTGDEPLEAALRGALARGIPSGGLLPILPGWTDEPGPMHAWLDRLAAAGASFATAVASVGDGEARRVLVEARSRLAQTDADAFFERVHHRDWTAATLEGLRRFREAAKKFGLAPLPPRPRGRGEPRANSAAAARLEERAHALEGDEHRAALLHAAARWIDESGRDLGLVVREGNFARVFPFGALAAEAESAFREERPG